MLQPASVQLVVKGVI